MARAIRVRTARREPEARGWAAFAWRPKTGQASASFAGCNGSGEGPRQPRRRERSERPERPSAGVGPRASK